MLPLDWILEEVFHKMNHGQFLVDHPDEVARRILSIV